MEDQQFSLRNYSFCVSIIGHLRVMDSKGNHWMEKLVKKLNLIQASLHSAFALPKSFFILLQAGEMAVLNLLF